MNKRGHPQTLVAAHTGNQNAVKAGVFSSGILAARAREVHAIMEEQPHPEVLEEVLRREVAHLVALSEAMDRSLDDEGILSRRGEPRTLVSLRLRLNEKLVRTAGEYDAVVQRRIPDAPTTAATEDESIPSQSVDDLPTSLPSTIASCHRRSSMDELPPRDLDPERFLRALIVNRSVPDRDRLRARSLLTRRRKARPALCLCSSTLVARDAIEFRHWIDDARDAGIRLHPDDAVVAAVVRRLAEGEKLEPWDLYRRTTEAFETVVAEATEESGEEIDEAPTLEDDPTVEPFWRTLLSADKRVNARRRLDAFKVLDELEVLRRCTCGPQNRADLPELRVDEARAYVMRVLMQVHYRAALAVAQFPQTYLALRDTIDARLLAGEAVGAQTEKRRTRAP